MPLKVLPSLGILISPILSVTKKDVQGGRGEGVGCEDA